MKGYGSSKRDTSRALSGSHPLASTQVESSQESSPQPPLHKLQNAWILNLISGLIWAGAMYLIQETVLKPSFTNVEAKHLRQLQSDGDNSGDEGSGDDDDDGFEPWSAGVGSYVSLPIIAGLVGYGTNKLALKMTFWPTYFLGIELYRGGPFKGQPVGICGWQGIIPTKAGEMAAKSVDMMMTKLFNMKEIFSRLDGGAATEHMRPGFEKTMDRVLDDVIKEQFPTDWERLTGAIKAQLLSWANQELEGFSANFMNALTENLDDVFDLKHMVVTEFTTKPKLLNDVFLNVGAKELVFIERSGFYFGFLFGLMQIPIFAYYPEDWILPVAGVITGYATNWLALKMIFQPIEPIKICGFTLHGLFMQRQQEASAMFAKQTCQSVLYSKNIFHYMLFGPKRDQFRQVLVAQTNEFLDRVLGNAHGFVKLYMGENEFIKMTRNIEQATIANIEEILNGAHPYIDKAIDLETEIRTKMQALPYKDFEGVLHPVFEEDELKLIVVGAVLGMIVGFFQAYVIFA